MGSIFRNAGTLRIDEASLLPFFANVFEEVLTLVLPIMLAVLVAGMAGNIVQIGFLFTSKPFVPKVEKLNPIKGIKKVFSLKSLVEVIKAIFKFLFIGLIAFLVLNKEMASFPSLMQLSVGEILEFVGDVAFDICFYVCLGLVFMAAVDFAYQKWQHQKNLRMTKQEIKDESKQSEGDPKVKGRIRQIQMETARRRMMEQVPKADVVITNPTHLAVCLKYTHEKMAAPQVIAKGADFIALKIRKIEEENQIPIVENKPLARTLFKGVDLGGYVPVNLYRAVAEVLAYVYRLKNNNT